MNDFIQNINLPIDAIVRYSTIIIWIIVAIIIAKIVSEVVGSGIKKATFIKKAFKKIDVSLNMEIIWNIISKSLYFLIIFAWIVAILNYLNISIELLNDILDNFLPKFLNALGLAIIAWFLATISKTAIIKGSKAMDLNKKINSESNVSESIGVIAYWSIIVFFLPQILEKLGQNELLKPITNMNW